MATLIALLAVLLGWASPVLAGDAAPAACNLSLAREGEALPSGVAASARVRIVRPGQAVTEDFRPDRTTIRLDAEGVVVSVRRG
jgi:hypothetical protein